MTDYIARKAEDLKVGDLFAHWAEMYDNLYPEASRIESIVKTPKGMDIALEDCRTLELTTGMIVVIQELA